VTEPVTNPQRTSTPRATGSWLRTALIALMLIGGALWWRSAHDRGQQVGLSRTRKLAAQKTASLTAYNDAIADRELLAFFSQHASGHTVSAEALAALHELVLQHVLPTLWRESQRKSPARFVSHGAMAEATGQFFPRELIVNGDVILFPDDPELRIIVAEAPQDHFRDSAWHWRWIGLFIDQLAEGDRAKLRELDIYAAEELSELLSVIAVGVVQLAARDRGASGAPIDASAIRETFQRIEDRRTRTAVATTDASKTDTMAHRPVSFSADTKKKIVNSLPQPMFRDVSAALDLDYVHHFNLELSMRRIHLEVPLGLEGGGVASEDFDADGWPDLYFAGDRGGRMYRNMEGKRFVDASAQAGLPLAGETRAGYFIDYDNDGDLDLFITCVWQSNRLLENKGVGHFVDVTDETGLASGKDITHEAVWFDMDNDGLLDLYTASFGRWTEGAVPTLGRINTNAGPNRLYRHHVASGKHKFVEVGALAGVDDRGWTHCVGAWDIDQDGYMDLVSLNDFGASLVYRNIGGERFEEVSRTLNLDALYNSMNFTLLDLTHDGHLSAYISQIMKLTHRQRYRKPTEETQIVFTPESIENLRTLVTNRLYSRRPDGVYQDLHDARIEPAELGWAWDAGALDYENDGDLDLLILNGTESRVPGDRRTTSQAHIDGRLFLLRHAEQRNVFYMSENGYFYDVSSHCPLAYKGNSRGSAFFDFDRDGDLDVAINDYDAPARIYENLQASGNNWLGLELQGTRSSRNAIGARVEVRFADQARYDQVVSGSGFLSQDPMRLHFGLGKADKVDSVIITWPSGTVQKLGSLPGNKIHTLREEGAEKSQ
jgi:hypothetical protein